jgi:hypothetical protein
LEGNRRGGSKWAGGKRFKSKKKNQKKKKKKKNWMGGGEKIKLQNKTEIRAEQGQTKKVSLGWHRDRKENPISAPSIHVGALVGAGSLWPPSTSAKLTLIILFSEMLKFSFFISSKSKNIVKGNSEYLGMFHLLK